jgi:hypothetical protein
VIFGIRIRDQLSREMTFSMMQLKCSPEEFFNTIPSIADVQRRWERRGKTGMRYFHGAFLQAALIVMPVALAKSASSRSLAIAWCQIPRLPFHSPQDVGRSNAPNF